MARSEDEDFFDRIERGIKDREVEKMRGKDIKMEILYDPSKESRASWSMKDHRLLSDARMEAGRYELRLQKLNLESEQKKISGLEIVRQAVASGANLSARVGDQMIEQGIPDEFCSFTLLLPGTIWWRRYVEDDADVEEHRFAYLCFDQPDDLDAYWALRIEKQECQWDVRYLRLLVAKRIS